MAKLVLRRLLSAIPTIFFAASLVFFLARILPGDPALTILGDSASAQALEILRAKLGLDQPLLQQYLQFLAGLMHLDLGVSMISGGTVLQEAADALPYTLELTAFAIGFGVLVGVPMGVAAALRRNRLPDMVTRFGALMGLSCPPFFIGICLILVFSIYWPVFPVVNPAEGGNRLVALILPGVTLGLSFLAFVARAARSSVLEAMNEPFVRTARMKGLRESRVVWLHICRSALLPIITIAGLYFGILMGNSVITEVIFTRPGLGKLIIGALNSRDYVMLQGLTVIYCLIVIVVGLLTELLCLLIDPRLRSRR